MDSLQLTTTTKYATLKEGEAALSLFAQQKGFEIKRGKLKRDKTTAKEIRKVPLECIHVGVYKEKGSMMRKTSTRLTNCTWKGALVRKVINGVMVWEWVPPETDSHYGHDLSPANLPAYPKTRTLTDLQKELVKSMTSSGIKSRDIRATLLEEYPELTATSKDIYNEKQRHRREELNGDRPVEAFMKHLANDDVVHRVQIDDLQHITHLLIVPKATMSIAKDFSANAVFVLDCTYKTNR